MHLLLHAFDRKKNQTHKNYEKKNDDAKKLRIFIQAFDFIYDHHLHVR